MIVNGIHKTVVMTLTVTKLNSGMRIVRLFSGFQAFCAHKLKF